MSWPDFFVLLGVMCAGMYLMRLVPITVLAERELSPKAKRLLGYIPPATFAALVANDLLSPDMFSAGAWAGFMPLIAAAIVVLVAMKTQSMVWCIVVGIFLYAAFSMIPL